MEKNVTPEIEKLGFTFHRTFPLNRPAISQILKLVKKSKKPLSRKEIRNQTNLGSIYVEAMPRYGWGAGLLNKNLTLTPFGENANQYDPSLDQISTQWLLHYHMSASYGSGPIFWQKLIATRFRSGDEFVIEDVANHITQYYKESERKTLAERSARSTATIFIGTYTSIDDGLGKLGILEQIDENRYRVVDPTPPPLWVVAYALVDLWINKYPDLVTVNLRDLYGENGLTNIFMIGRGRLNLMLEELQQEGMVELYQVAPPYQVVLHYKEKELLLKKLYGVA